MILWEILGLNAVVLTTRLQSQGIQRANFTFRMLALTYVNFLFSARVINPWNALPTIVKYSKSINEFKNQIDKLPKLQDTFYGFDE